MNAPLPPDEHERLRVLHQYQIMDSIQESAFDELTQLAAQICGTSMAAISLVDQDRQWFKSKIGLDVQEAPREIAFCAHAILRKDEIMEIPDAQLDQRFADNILVTHDPHIRFYAGAPLVAHENQALGTLCVLDSEPRTLTADQTAALQTLSRNVVAQLELRRHVRRLREENEEKLRLLELAEKSRNALLSVLEDEQRIGQELRRWADAFENCAQGMLIGVPADQSIFICNPALASLHGLQPAELAGFPILSLYDEADHALVRQGIAQADDSGHSQFEATMSKADGTSFQAQTDFVSVRDAGGCSLYWVVTVQDITERKVAAQLLARSNRALKMLGACNEALVRSTEESELLAEVCRLAVEIGGYRLAWVGYAQSNEERSIIPVAHAGYDEGYLEEIQLSWSADTPYGQGPAGRTIRTGKAIVGPDIFEADSGFHWLEEARTRGYRGVICLPLCQEKSTFGMLALYTGEVLEAGEDELKLLQEMADDLAFGIRHLRNQNEKQRIQDIVLHISQAVSTSGSTEFFELVTRSMIEALDADGGVIGKLGQTDKKHVETLSLILDEERVENVCYHLPGTPCEGVSLGYTSIFESGLQATFPEDEWLTSQKIEAYIGVPLFSKEGEVVGLMAVFYRRPLEDTSLAHSTLKIFAARVGAELEREESDNRIREQASLLEKAQDAIIVRRLDHSITYWNKSAERLYGWAAEEVMDKPITQLLYKDTTQYFQATQLAIEQGEWIGELHQVGRMGNEIIIEGRWTMVRDSEGRPHSILAINTDITEKKKLEQQFLRAQRMESIGTLAGGIAHDLNNVLSPILMAIDLLKMSTQDEKTLAILSTIRLSAARGADMVQQVLSFARGMDGQRLRIDPALASTDVQKIIHDTFPKNIHFEVNLPPSLPAFLGDPTQVHQVLLNLCVNARDAMPHGGTLTLSADTAYVNESDASSNLRARPGHYVVLKVTDNGNGIRPEMIDKIFDPFFTTKELGKGTGLGLSTVLAIVKSHNGFINVYSEPNNGTTFKVYFPAEATEALKKTDAQVSHPRGNGELILLIDDESAVRNITRQTLEAFGYRVLTAGDGAEAVSIFAQRQKEIEVVFTDMMMPVMDGPATIQVLMRMKPDLKIIAASGLNANASVAKALDLGVKFFLPKPYNAQAILTTLQKVLTAPPTQG